ncbi:RNA-dependent RNA polymerase [rice-associated noda-like virus 2]|nr:RNA-dependent RNA polymerase [rice-associated noda-like virus 2]
MSCCFGFVLDLTAIYKASSSILSAAPNALKLVGAISATSVGVACVAKSADRVKRFLDDPYPSPIDNAILRAVQRTIVRITNKDVQRSWFPLDSLTGFLATRSGNNGHAESGTIRDSARELITSAVNSLGAQKYELSPSHRSIDDDSPNAHVHYAPGDLALEPDSRPPTDRQILVGVDVDYYVDDIDNVLEHSPCIFYTFNPVHVSGKDGDSTFRIKGDEIDYTVSGGSNWRHKVWNWCDYGEFLEVRPRKRTLLDWALYCIGVRRVLYVKVFHSRPWTNMENRALVWVLPQFTHYKFAWIKSEINARRLERVKYASVNRPGWNTIVSSDAKGNLTVSLGRAGEDLSIRLPKDHHDLLLALGSTQSVSSRMIGLKYTDVVVMTLFSQYYTGQPSNVDAHARIGNPVAAIPKVHWPTNTYADAPVVSARVYASCIVSDEAMMPMIKRWETLSDSLERRVTFVRNERTPKSRIQSLANVFIRLVVPDHLRGHPLSLEDAALMLDKPSQTLAVKQIWETVDMPARRLIESFVKNEPCMKAGRIISSFADARFLLKLSTYTLKFREEVLHAEHNKHWFCPGLTPPQIAEKVVEYCANVEHPMEGDFSNFDGSVSDWLQRHVMNAVMLRYFGDEPELRQYLNMLISCPARAKRFRFYYDAGVGVKSGSPTTCDLNTVLNAFIQFVSVVSSHPDLTHDECFRSIGLAFGDDSLFDAQYKLQFAKTATELGMDLKIESGDPRFGVTFLARVFPDPRTTATSFQDPLRTWRKLHITTRDPNVPLADAAVDRLEGYLVTDSLTPVTSAYCRWLLRMYYPTAGSVAARRARKSHNKEKPYWLTNEGGSWPQASIDRKLMLNVISARVGIDVETLEELEAKFETLKDPFALTPIDREVECPYANTMDADGLPVAPVDLRQEELIQDAVDIRASEVVSGSSSAEGGGAAGSTGQGGDVALADREGGPAGVRECGPGAGSQNQAHRSGPVGQAQGGGVPQGGGGATELRRSPGTRGRGRRRGGGNRRSRGAGRHQAAQNRV